MKVLFAGPSLYGVAPDLTGIELRPPAVHGDIARAVLQGATAVGLIDGNFEAVAAVWHKEIVFALASGVTMLGSSSMGALRAAECAPLGMIPVGTIAGDYASGANDDDAAVALTHAPPEFGYQPFTEAMVDVAPSLDRLVSLGLLTVAQRAELWERANRIHFKDRTDEAIFARWGDPGMLDAYRAHRINQKAADAVLLVEQLHACPDVRGPAKLTGPTGALFAKHVVPRMQQEPERDFARKVRAG